MAFEITRYHDFDAGHRVSGHEGKCRHLHGHSYRVHFTCTAPRLDEVGRVIDFGVVGKLLCRWLEDNWDHRFLIWEQDPWAEILIGLDASVCIVPFNPTAENMARHLVTVVGPAQLVGTDAILISCRVEETRKCSATYSLGLFDFSGRSEP